MLLDMLPSFDVEELHSCLGDTIKHVSNWDLLQQICFSICFLYSFAFFAFLLKKKVLYGLIFPLFVDYLQTVDYPANTKITLRIDGVSWILTHDFLLLAWRETHFFLLHVQPINKVWKRLGYLHQENEGHLPALLKPSFFSHITQGDEKREEAFLHFFREPYMQNVSFPACQMMRTTQKKINKVFKEGKGLF